MGSIADKLNYLNETKQEIKQAIINKGVDVSDTDTFRSFADKIEAIEGGVVSGTQLSKEILQGEWQEYYYGRVNKETGAETELTHGDTILVIEDDRFSTYSRGWFQTNTDGYAKRASSSSTYYIEEDKIKVNVGLGDYRYYDYVVEDGVAIIKLKSDYGSDYATYYIIKYKRILPEMKNLIGDDTITQNGTYVPANYSSYGFSRVKVEVPSQEPNLIEKQITENGTYIASDDGVDGYSAVSVNIESKVTEPEGIIEINENGTHNVKDYATAEVNVQPKLQEKTTDTNGDVVPDEGFDGLSKVTVNVASSGGEDMLQAMVDSLNSAQYLFYRYGGYSLDFAKNLNLSNVTAVDYMCQASSVLNVNLDFGGCTATANSVFSSTGLRTAKLLNTQNITSMSEMFSQCTKLTTVEGLDTSSCTAVRSMFNQCSSLTTVPTFNLKSATDMYSMFYNCKKLINISLSNTNQVTNVGSLFYNCEYLKTVTGLDLISATNVSNMFYNCKLIENLEIKNIKVALQLASGTTWGANIKADSLIGIVKELVDTGSSKTLTMGSHNQNKISSIYVKLLDDDGSGKLPCEVCESTDEGAMLITDYVALKNWAIA